MASYRGTVDYIGVNAEGDGPGTSIEKVCLSSIIDLGTDSAPEAGDRSEYYFWTTSTGGLETSEVLLRRSIWLSMAQRAVEARGTFDLVVRTEGDASAIVVAVVLIPKGVEYGARNSVR